jgi:hypothetical protein
MEQVSWGSAGTYDAEEVWSFHLYPGAREGVAVRRWAGGTAGSGTAGKGTEGWGQPDDARKVAARRAGTKVRRYCAENRLNRLGTLTYGGAGCHDVVELHGELGAFFRRLRRGLGGSPFPYLWVGEWHQGGQGGHGLHAHFAVGRYVRRSVIEECWPHGYVHIKLLGDLPAASTALEQARLGARYLAKYVVKAFDDPSSFGLHRYEVAQGFAPEVLEFEGRTAGEVIGDAVACMGSVADYVSASWEWEGYDGPPALFLSWA